MKRSAVQRPRHTVPGDPKDPGGLQPELIAVLACAAALWGWFQVQTGIRLEDALITARYVENLAGGHGYVFNTGERVLGTTSPLHTLLLAALAVPFGGAHVGTIAVLVGIAFGLLALRFLHSGLRAAGVGRIPAITAVALFAANAGTLKSVTGGLETPLVLAFMIMGMTAVIRGRWNWAAVCAALLILTRVDGAVWAGLLLVAAATTLRLRVWKPLALGLLLLVPWIVFATIYFGSAVPTSVQAKMVIHADHPVADYVPWLLQSLDVGFNNIAGFAIWFALVITGALAVLAQRPARLWVLAVYPPLFTAALATVHAPSFWWYMVPVTWCGIALAGIGAETLTTALAAHAASAGWSRRVLQSGFAAIGVVVGVVTIIQAAREFRVQRDYQENETTTRRAIGEWLLAHTSPGAIVAMEAIGYQGTYSQRRVVDLAGLVTPEVVRIRQESGSSAVAFERIRERYRPDAIVLRSLEVDGNLQVLGGPLFAAPAQREAFLAEYREAARFVAPHPQLWGPYAGLTIYARR